MHAGYTVSRKNAAQQEGDSMAKAPKDYKSYLKNKCIVGYGIVNGVINALIFRGLNAGNPDALFGQAKIIEEMALTGVLLGLILTWCVVPLTKMDLKKGVYQRIDAAEADGASGSYGFAQRLPRHAVPLSFAVGGVALAVVVILSGLFTLAAPLPLTRTGMMLLKGVMCAVTGGVSGYCVIGRVTSAYEPAVLQAA